MSSSRHPRSAIDTIERIATERYLYASTRHMPRKTPCVSFTGLTPHDAVPLMRWRARYGQMTFEPYGLGIKRTVAERMGIAPVTYYDVSAKSAIATLPAWRTQSRGVITNWQAENEYRHCGDLDLSPVPDDALVLFCRFEHEVESLAQATGIRTIPMFTG
jgi:hypothetical protein